MCINPSRIGCKRYRRLKKFLFVGLLETIFFFFFLGKFFFFFLRWKFETKDDIRNLNNFIFGCLDLNRIDFRYFIWNEA